MLRAAAKNQRGQPVVILGLSAENRRRLGNGEPIRVDLHDFGFDGELVIFGGETEEKMAAELAAFIGPDTRVTIDSRLFRGSD